MVLYYYSLIIFIVLFPFSSVGNTKSGYNHDGITTYCWASRQSSYLSTPAENLVSETGIGPTQCPGSIKIGINSDQGVVLEPIKISWIVSYDISFNNALRVTDIYSAMDLVKAVPAEIIHSNLHSCEFGTLCDPFNSGRKGLNPTVNQIANFSNAQFSFESDEMVFSAPGVYSIIAHIILPGRDALRKRYDYATYSKLTIKENKTTNSSSGNSSRVTIVVIGILVFLFVGFAIIIYLKKRNSRMCFESHDIISPHGSNNSVVDAPWTEYSKGTAARNIEINLNNPENKTHDLKARKSEISTAPPDDYPLRSLYSRSVDDGSMGQFPRHSNKTQPNSRSHEFVPNRATEPSKNYPHNFNPYDEDESDGSGREIEI